MDEVIGELVGEGRTACVYEYGEDKVLKLFKPGYENLAIEEYEKHCIIQNAGAKAPRAYELCSEGDRKGIIYQRLIGQSMGSLMLASTENIGPMLSDMVRLHLSVGKCKPDSALQTVKSRITDHIDAAWDLTDVTKQNLLNNLQVMPDSDSLCHGDFHPDNIFIEDGNLYIIDWLTACRGCFAADVARTIIIIKFGILSNDVPDKVCKLAGMMCDMYLKELVSIGAVKSDDVERWMPLQLAARLIEGNSEREQRALLEALDRYNTI